MKGRTGRSDGRKVMGTDGAGPCGPQGGLWLLL